MKKISIFALIFILTSKPTFSAPLAANFSKEFTISNGFTLIAVLLIFLFFLIFLRLKLN